jgi:hypothetical protein
MKFTDTPPQVQGQILAVRTIIASAADWRSAMAKKYPDIRNKHAAQLLESLANETAPPLTDVLIEELSTSHNLGSATKDTARRVGFSLFPASMREFLQFVFLRVTEIDRTLSKSEGER